MREQLENPGVKADTSKILEIRTEYCIIVHYPQRPGITDFTAREGLIRQALSEETRLKSCTPNIVTHIQAASSNQQKCQGAEEISSFTHAHKAIPHSCPYPLAIMPN